MRVTRGILCVVGLIAMATADTIGGFTGSGGARAYADGTAAIVPAVTVRAEVPATVRFGDSFAVKITVTNNLKTAVRWAKDRVWVEPREWDGRGNVVSGQGESVALQTDKDPKAEVVIAPGATASFVVPENKVTQRGLGQVEGVYVIHTDDPELLQLWKNEDLLMKVAVEIVPSGFLEMAWRPQTDAERAKVQEEFYGRLRRIGDENAAEERTNFIGLLSYTGAYAIPYMEQAASDKDAVVRETAVQWFPTAAWAVDVFNTNSRYGEPAWGKGLVQGDGKDAQTRCLRAAVTALADVDLRVRAAGIVVLRDSKDHDALAMVMRLANDPQSSVRGAAVSYLSLFAGEKNVAETIVQALSDVDEKVRQQALDALEHSPTAPPVGVLRNAFAAAHGAAAMRLLAMLFEQEDGELPATLAKGFAERSEEERLEILSAVAGHRDASVLELVKAGLVDKSVVVQRAALLRLMAFPRETAGPMMDVYMHSAPVEMAAFGKIVAQEIETRKQFGFLRDGVVAMNAEFPSRNGSMPMVSPDGKWVAYTEAGWEHNMSFGIGRSGMPGITHVVRADGTGDKLVSDMVLMGWMADSEHVGTSLYGYAAISDLTGNMTAEFGTPLATPEGDTIMHHKTVDGYTGYWDGKAFSPDGKWLCPQQGRSICEFLGIDGSTMRIRLVNEPFGYWQAAWSPDGRYVACYPSWKQGISVIDVKEKTMRGIDIAIETRPNNWDTWKWRWNPWSKDSQQLTFVHDGQVWVMGADGNGERQLTFDAKQKAWPSFSRDGKRVAYITWQKSDRDNITPMGPTDLWVVDVETTLAARLTAPHEGQINCLDWIDDQTLIVDRVRNFPTYGEPGGLEKISLDKAVGSGQATPAR